MIGTLRHIDRTEHTWWCKLYRFKIIPVDTNNGTPLSATREICDSEPTWAKNKNNNFYNNFVIFLWIRMQTYSIAEI